MGKWTPDYVDDVLHAKIKSLVSGTIKRSSLEKTEPTISYEDFVNDLDTGDSFTTSLVDILVKELAERRTRPNMNDKRLIADCSAKSLRLLATPLRIYRDRSTGRFHPSRRRSTNLSEYLSAPPLEMDMEEDEDIFERMLDVGNTIEGVRINSDLYEAYGTNVGAGPSARALSSTPSSEDAPSPVVSHPPYFRWPPSSYGPAPTNLTRQPSIRRPVRPSSRSVDFNEFTHRRRSSTRENSNTHVEPNDSLSAVRNWVAPPQNPARRFFPFIRRRFEHADPWSSDIPPPETEEPNGPLNYDSADPPSGPWFSLTPPVPRETSTMEEVLADVELSDERVHASVVPRLRRGGLRAPESILSRHTSPFPNPNPLHDDGASFGENTLTDATGNTPPGEPAGGYPTPGSTDHEFFP